MIEGKTALVTGGGRGIGRAFCLGLADAGAHVAVADIDEVNAQRTADHIRRTGRDSLPLKVDVTQPDAVQSMIGDVVNHFGTLDIGVNNVGGVRSARWAENVTVEDFDATLRLNLRTIFNCAREEARVMGSRGEGKIINTASISGMTVNSSVAYSAAKAGVIMLTKVMAVEWGKYGITVNCISPGRTVTPGASWLRFPDDVKDRWAAAIPLKRLGHVDDLVGAVVYLASHASDYMTGQNLVIDGGASLGTYEPESFPFFQDAPQWALTPDRE